MNKTLGLLVLSALLSNDEKARGETAQRLEESATVLTEGLSVPGRAIPKDLLRKAYCIVIVPAAKKDSVFEGQYGKGFICCRPGKGGVWSAPGAVRLEGGNLKSDVILLAMSQRGANRLLSGHAVVGNEGLGLLSWSRIRGVSAGLAAGGSELYEDLDGNEALYGKRVQNREIVMKGLASTSMAGKLLSILSNISFGTPHATCDLNGDGVVNNFDVQIELKQVLGVVACTNGDLNGDGSCNVIDLQRVTNAALGESCRVGP